MNLLSLSHPSVLFVKNDCVCVAGFWVWPVFKALFTKAPWHLCAWPWQGSSISLWSSIAVAPNLSSTMEVSHNLWSSCPGALGSLFFYTKNKWYKITVPPCAVLHVYSKLTKKNSSSRNMQFHSLERNSWICMYTRRQILKMFLKVLFEIAKNWKQLKWLSTGKLINCYIHTINTI